MLDIRRRTGVLLFVVTLGHIFLISAQVQSKSGVPVLEAVTFGVFSRVQGATAAVVHGVRNCWGNYVGLRGVRAENEALRKQVADLEVRLQEQRALAARSARLQELMNLQTSTTLPTIAADVIAGNPNPGMRTITIDRGAADGVQADMAVIAPTGIVGRVIGVPAAHAARVQLLIDRHAAAGALTERTRAGGMVVGVDGDPPLTHGAGLEPGRREGRRSRRGLGGRRHLSQGVHDRTRRDVRARLRAVSDDHRAAVGRLLEPRGSAGRARAGAARDRRTAAPPRPADGRDREMKTAGVLAGARCGARCCRRRWRGCRWRAGRA